MNRHLCVSVAAARRLCAVALMVFAAVPFATSRAHASEPFMRFLDGLRDQQLYDVAMDYLAQMRNSSLISDEAKATLNYEEGKTLIEWAREDSDIKSRTKNLELARERLQVFIKEHADHEMAGSAAMQLGNVLVLRGTMTMESSAKPSNASQKEVLLKQARALFEESKTVFKKSEDDYEKRVNEFKGIPPANDPTWVDRRDAVRQAFLQANLYSAAVLQELAKTYPFGSKENKEQLQAAADKYRKIYERWRTLMAGQLARVKQGQCLQDLGDTKTAIGLYGDLLNQPNDLSEFRKLKAGALYRTQQCWLDASQNNPELAHKLGREFIDFSKPDELKQPDWLAVRYYTALAAKKLADSLTDANAAGRKKSLMNEARDDAKFVAGIRGSYRDDARNLLTEVVGKEDATKDPVNFAEAMERGQQALEEMQTKEAQARAGIAGADPKKLMEEAVAARKQAMKYFNMAIKLRDSETKIDDINGARYYLCFLDYQAGEFYDAAVLGEFLARRYPGSAGGRPGAKIALAAYLQGYNDKQMPPLLKEFDRRRMGDLATYIAGRWKGEPEADDAWAVMLALAVMEHDLKSGEGYLAKIPTESGKRGESELKLGQAYWGAYLTEQRKEGDERMSQKQFDQMLARSRELFEAGMGHMKAGMKSGLPLSMDTIYGALSLAQVYLSSNEANKAVATLEDSETGPIKLVQAKHPMLMQPGGTVPTEAYKTALRAYVEVKDLDKAQATMSELEKLVSASGPQGQSELTRIYVSMGRALEDQIKALKEANKNDDAKKVTASFEVFLDKIRNGGGANFSSLNWVAETFFSLGAGYDTNTGKAADNEAKAYYEKALETDKKTIELAEADPKFAPSPDALYAVNLRIARVYRRLGRYQDAVDLIQKILTTKPLLVEAQLDGARSFMDWASTNPLYNNLAILGGRKDAAGKNIIFGWIELSSRLNGALSNPGTNPPEALQAMQAWYFDSQYGLTMAHTNLAQAEQNPAKKAELFKKAISDITITVRFNPILTTPQWKEWYDKFDAQAKVIQKLQGQKPEGIKAIVPNQPVPAGAPAAAAPAANAPVAAAK